MMGYEALIPPGLCSAAEIVFHSSSKNVWQNKLKILVWLE